MTIDIKPETERLVREELQRGHFRSVDEIIVQGVEARREKQTQLEPVKGPRSVVRRIPVQGSKSGF
jgi:Arc/MetJ-type ribon-helix-helix transcriptional regulator